MPSIHDVPYPLSPSALPGANRRTALLGLLALTATSLLPGCSGSNARTQTTSTLPPANTQPTPSGALTSATLAVSTSAQGTLGASFLGLSYEKSALVETPRLFSASNANLIALFQLLGPGVLRVGGNSVDRATWNPAGAGQIIGQIAPADVDALAAFVQATGWQILYGINLGGSGPNPYTSGSLVATTSPALAAAEAAYAAKAFGSSLLGIEIGNECDLYGSSYYSGATWNLAIFEALWAEYRAAIVAQSPGIPVTGPAAASSESTWTVPFGQWATKNNLTLLTQHYYRGNGQSAISTAANLITPDTTLTSDLALLKSGASAVGIPYRMAECNSYYNGGASGVSNAYASSLWVIDFLFDCALGGASGINFHGGGNGTGYTPIADANGTVVAARPEYYGILLVALAGQGTLCATNLNAGSLNVTAYTVKNASGINLVIVNKDISQNLELTVQMPAKVNTATLLELTQLTPGNTVPDITATPGVTLQEPQSPQAEDSRLRLPTSSPAREARSPATCLVSAPC